MTDSPRIVHSCFGRVRIYCPDATGQFTARLRSLAGVTSAEAREITGNILVLFDPRATNESAILAALQEKETTTPVAAPLPETRLAIVAAPTAVLVEAVPVTIHDEHLLVPEGYYVTGLRKTIYEALGWMSVGMAVVGAILPGIPTVPFVVLAAYFFIRSSPKAHAWLRQSRWFGQFLRDWEEHRAIRRSAKYTAAGLIVVAMVFISVIGLPQWLVLTILALEVIGLTIVLRLPVVEAPRPLLVG